MLIDPMNFKPPILFIAFNRPSETKRSFDCIRKEKPNKLYVAIDGPRNDKDKELCATVIEIVKNIDWECETHYLIRSENKGCGRAVNEALDWFFENEEMGIILEDDIIVQRPFFRFCSDLLTKYQYNEKVWMICGNNLLSLWGNNEYFFSKIGSVWGWASWRRAWSKHDKDLSTWNDGSGKELIKQALHPELAAKRIATVQAVVEGKVDTWDYQFTYSRIINHGLSIIPKANLIENIGFNPNATHTFDQPHFWENQIVQTETIDTSIQIPVKPDDAFDISLHMATQQNPSSGQSFAKKLRDRMKKVIGLSKQ